MIPAANYYGGGMAATYNPYGYGGVGYTAPVVYNTYAGYGGYGGYGGFGGYRSWWYLKIVYYQSYWYFKQLNKFLLGVWLVVSYLVFSISKIKS